jgi:hypothetical protein
MARAIDLDEEFRHDRGRRFGILIQGDMIDRKPYIMKLEKIREYYYGDIQRIKRYPGQPNLHLPVLTEKVENLVDKTMDAFYGSDPIVNVITPGNDVDPERTQLNEDFLNWNMEVKIPDSYRHIKRWVRGQYLDGPSIMMATYCYDTRTTVQSRFHKTWWRPGDIDLTGQEITTPRVKLPLEILMEEFGPGLQNAQLSKNSVTIGDGDEVEFDGVQATISFIENRVLFDDVEVYFYGTKYVDEVELCVHRPTIIKDGVELVNVEVEDFIIPYRAWNIQDAPRVTRQYWLTIPEIEAKVAKGEWKLSENQVNSLKALATTSREETTSRRSIVKNNTLKIQRDAQVGEQTVGPARSFGFEPFIDNRVLVFQVFCRDDIGDGKTREVIYHMPAYLEYIARADYLEAVYPHGHRPFSVLHGVSIDDRFYTLPLSQWLYPINEECDTILNQTHEAQEIINNPFFFYESMSFGDDARLQNGLFPGQGIPVASTSGILFPQFPQQPLANLQSMDSLLLFADRLTLSPQSVGSSQVRNSPRTARGTLALLSESNSKVDGFITESQQSGWRELVYQIHSLLYHYGPDEQWFWVTGKKKPMRIARSDMDGRFEYIFRGNTTNTNKEVRRTIATQRFQMLAPDPAYMQNPVARHELILDYLRHNSEGVNIDRLDPGIPGTLGDHPPMDQNAEIELMLRGQDLNVLPSDNDAEHIAKIRQFMQGRFSESLQPWQIALLANHMNKHAMQMMQKQVQGSMQSVANPGVAPQNIPATGGELSGLEGGVQ